MPASLKLRDLRSQADKDDKLKILHEQLLVKYKTYEDYRNQVAAHIPTDVTLDYLGKFVYLDQEFSEFLEDLQLFLLKIKSSVVGVELVVEHENWEINHNVKKEFTSLLELIKSDMIKGDKIASLLD